VNPASYAAGKFWLDVILIVINAAIGIYVWYSNREKVTSKRFEALEREVALRVSKTEMERFHIDTKIDMEKAKSNRDARCANHGRETKSLEQSFNHLHLEVSKLPDRKEVKELSDSMQTLAGQLGNLGGRMDGINRAVDLMNEFLIEQGGKK